MEAVQHTVAIVDFAAGNLFSVRRACEAAGLAPRVTSDTREILFADAVILPGVGAFGDAMDRLRRLDLISPLADVAAEGKPLIGICLGMQLLMEESEEFGQHRGLGLIEGRVVRFAETDGVGQRVKVPHVGWNRLTPPCERAWDETPLASMPAGCHMYFVHSYFVEPNNPDDVLSTTKYGGANFASSLNRGNVWGFQFHPEKSGPAGLRVYENVAAIVRQAFQPAEV